MKLSLVLNRNKDVDQALDFVVDAERRGFHAVWAPQVLALDAMTVLALAATRTERILLGTSVVPTWPRHPFVMAQQATTVSRVADGRFRLGVGTSHVPVIRDMLGIEFEKPIRHVREYLEVLRSLVSSGSASFQGEQYRVAIGLDTPDDRLPIMLSVLSEQMTRTAGALADGAITWLAPPSYVESTVVPLVREAAEAAGRPAPPVVCQVPAACTEDADAVRKVVPRLLGVYPMLPFYNAMLVKAGAPDAEAALTEGWSDDLIDAVIPYGDAAALAARVQEYHDAGADEVAYAPFPVGGDWEASLTRTVEALASIATSTPTSTG